MSIDLQTVDYPVTIMPSTDAKTPLHLVGAWISDGSTVVDTNASGQANEDDDDPPSSESGSDTFGSTNPAIQADQ